MRCVRAESVSTHLVSVGFNQFAMFSLEVDIDREIQIALQ